MYIKSVNYHVLFESTELWEQGCPFSTSDPSKSLHGLFSGMGSQLCVEKERSSEQPKSKSVLSLRATGRSTVPNRGYRCLSCGIKVSGVGKRSHGFIRGR